MPYINWRLSDPDTVFNPVLDLRIGFNCKCKSVILISLYYCTCISLVNGLPYLKKIHKKLEEKKVCGDIFSERVNIATTQKRLWCIIRNSSSLHNHLLSGDIRKSGDSPWYTWRTLRTLYYLGIHVDSRRDRTLFGVTLLLNQMLLIDETHCLHFSLLIFGICTPYSFHWHGQK